MAKAYRMQNMFNLKLFFMEREKIYLVRFASKSIGRLATIVIILNVIAILIGGVLWFVGNNEHGSTSDTLIGIALYLITSSVLVLIFIPRLLKGLVEIIKCAENLNAYFRQKYEIVERNLDED